MVHLNVKSTGFSLVELMLMLALMGAIALIAIPKIMQLGGDSDLDALEARTVQGLYQTIDLAEAEEGLLPLDFGPQNIIEQYAQTISSAAAAPANCQVDAGDTTITLASGVVLAGVSNQWDQSVDYDPSRPGTQSGDVICAALRGPDSAPEEIVYITLIRKGDHVPGQLISQAVPDPGNPGGGGTNNNGADGPDDTNPDVDTGPDTTTDDDTDDTTPDVDPGPPNPQNPDDVDCDITDASLFVPPPQSANDNLGPTLGSLALSNGVILGNQRSLEFRAGTSLSGPLADNPSLLRSVGDNPKTICLWTQISRNVYIYDTQTGDHLYKYGLTDRGWLGLSSIRGDSRYQIRYYDNIGLFGTKNVTYPLHSINSLDDTSATLTTQTTQQGLNLYTQEQMETLWFNNN